MPKNKQKDKLKAIIIYKDRKIKVKKVKADENKLEISKNWRPTFEPEDILLWPRLFGNYPTVIVAEGQMRALNPFKKGKQKIPLTLEEISEFVKSIIARARTKIKPITMGQFIVLTLLLIALVVMNLIIMKRIGVF